MDTMRALRQVVMFKDVSEPVLRIVARAAEEVTLTPGETLISGPGAHSALFVICTGTVRALPFDGRTPPVLFGSGETLGDIQFMDGEPMSGTVTALERVDLLVLRADRLGALLDGHPEAAHELYRAIARSLAGRLRRAIAMVAFMNDRATAA